MSKTEFWLSFGGVWFLGFVITFLVMAYLDRKMDKREIDSTTNMGLSLLWPLSLVFGAILWGGYWFYKGLKAIHTRISGKPHEKD